MPTYTTKEHKEKIDKGVEPKYFDALDIAEIEEPNFNFINFNEDDNGRNSND